MRTVFKVVDVGHGPPKELGTFRYRQAAMELVVELPTEKHAGWVLTIELTQQPN